MVEVAAAVEEVVEESLVTPERDFGRNTGTWTNFPSLRRTSTSSTPMWPGDHWYVERELFWPHVGLMHPLLNFNIFVL